MPEGDKDEVGDTLSVPETDRECVAEVLRDALLEIASENEIDFDTLGVGGGVMVHDDVTVALTVELALHDELLDSDALWDADTDKLFVELWVLESDTVALSLPEFDIVREREKDVETEAVVEVDIEKLKEFETDPEIDSVVLNVDENVSDNVNEVDVVLEKDGVSDSDTDGDSEVEGERVCVIDKLEDGEPLSLPLGDNDSDGDNESVAETEFEADPDIDVVELKDIERDSLSDADSEAD